MPSAVSTTTLVPTEVVAIVSPVSIVSTPASSVSTFNNLLFKELRGLHTKFLADVRNKYVTHVEVKRRAAKAERYVTIAEVKADRLRGVVVDLKEYLAEDSE
ncbi:hypothetical protein F5X68DRAFT_238023 [Plectosphaerella plurivora]|uniref:Uncharacterized protein n=1 Tax=Plectosphaerella plurivora TaxID=936078 RepID=A0A9P8UPV9_9PEZI|nr:hypothetical protein F5X68DRAFT_238023 [Plectosphaerella plurivora]